MCHMRTAWPLSKFGHSPSIKFGMFRVKLALVFTYVLTWSLPTSSELVSNPPTHSVDCSANERLRCRVEEGLCASSPQSDDYPSPPHDLRVAPYLIANPSRKPDSYQLWVNVTWRATYNGDINKTRGFELSVLDKNTNRNWCFTLILDDPKWEERDRHESTRFRFSTVDKFEYGHEYYFELQSLPKPLNQTVRQNKDNHLFDNVIMPGHPEPAAPVETVVNYCSATASRSGAHPHASRWIAAFRIVYIHPKMRWIYVEFIAAPPQYCFEEYELRLVSTHMNHIKQLVRIMNDDLTYEIHDNVSVAFGNHTFEDVELGLYDIELTPVSHSRVDSRCLCPLANRVCTCSVSVWAEVEMPPTPTISEPKNPCDLLPPVRLPFDCPMKNDSAMADNEVVPGDAHETDLTSKWILLSCLIMAALIIVAVGAAFLLCYYRRYKRKGAGRMYLLPMSQTDMETTTNGSISREMSTVLRPVKLTIIYSHDCPEFERTVRHLVDYLNSQCFCNTRVDYLCANDIAANKFDWAYKSILEADRVLLLNSYGAYMRYQAKLVTSEYAKSATTLVERADAGPFDDLFLLQLDLLTQECQKNMKDSGLLNKFISVRFPFTPEPCVLPHANPYIRYELPKHFRSLIINVHQLPLLGGLEDDLENETSMPPPLKRVNKDDYYKCAEGERLRESIAAMTRFIQDRPDWFENLHVRRTFSNAVIKERPHENGSVAKDRSLEINRSHPIPDATRQVPSANQMDESKSPLLDHKNPDAQTETRNGATKNSVDTVDSGVAVSSGKVANGGYYSPKKLKAANGAIGAHENDLRQRLIA